MNTFSIREALRFGWDTFFKRPWFILGAALIMCLFSFSFSYKTGNAGSWAQMQALFPFMLTFGLLYSAISVAIEILFVRFLLKAHDSLTTMRYRDVWPPRPFWKYVGVKILTGLAVLLGFILLIVPGIIVALGVMFASYLVVDKKMWPIEAMKESWRVTKGHKGQLFLFMLSLLGINILGALALIVGLLVSIPVSMLATVHVYRTLSRSASPLPIVN